MDGAFHWNTGMSYIDPAGKVFSIDTAQRLVRWDEGRRLGPRGLEWDLSNACTLGCEFADGSQCHFAYTHVKGPYTNLPRRFPINRDKGGVIADTSMVLRALEQARACEVQSIAWTGGGEPTTHPEWVRIIEYAAVLGFDQGMFTHAGLLKPESARVLSERAEWVVVSLDFHEAESYARYKHVPQHRFTAACNGIVSLVGRKAKVGVSFLLHGQNWMMARDMVQLARNLGATYTTLRPTVHTQPDNPSVVLGDRAWVTDALPLLQELSGEPDIEVDPRRFQQYRDWTTHGYTSCKGIRLNATITPDGRVWVCPNRREFPNSCVGDLRTESFAEIWAKHPGEWTDFKDCRAMCRLHPVNQSVDQLYREREHGTFV
jgi:MoaA/NifB/PqqE/SkfB family radical SAM enzyme